MTKRIPEAIQSHPPHVLPTEVSALLTSLSSTSLTKSGPKHHEVPAAHGYAFYVKKGTHFRVVDIHGVQVVDMVAWVHPYPSEKAEEPVPDFERLDMNMKTLDPSNDNDRERYTKKWLQQWKCQQREHNNILRHTTAEPQNPTAERRPLTLPTEYMSMSNTRYHLRGVHPTISECLYTNASRPLLRLAADTVKTHDMTFMCCHPEFYAEMGLDGHRSCAANIAEAVTALKGVEMGHLQVPDPFNTFQNTPNYTLKPLGSSRKGDFVEWEVLEDAMVAVSSCPFDQEGFNAGKATSIMVVTDIVPE